MSDSVGGVIPVAHTPFLDDRDEIDWDSLQRQVDWAFDVGADGYCTGMVSELLRLTTAERIQLTGELSAMNQGRGSFVASVGAESTKQAVEFAEHAVEAGATALMAIPPISAALPSEEVVDYFRAIARSVEAPILVQDASGYVGKAIDISAYQALLDEFGPQRICFKPESSPVGPVVTRLLEMTAGKARVFEGSGGNLLIENFRRGVVGAIPGMEFLPAVVALWDALRQGDEDRAYRIYFPLCALVTLQLQAGLDGFLAVEKYVLKQRGLFTSDRRRRPYSWCLDEPTRKEVDRLLERLDAALGDTPKRG